MSIEQNEILSTVQLTQLAQQAMQHYPKQFQGEIKIWCQSENCTFMIQHGTQRYALRIHRPHYHSQHEIEGELDWLEALNQDTLTVPQAITSKSGERVLSLNLDEQTQRHAVLFNWVEGEMPTVNVDPADFQKLGEITARLHQHSKNWHKPDDFQRIVWNHQSMVGPQGHWGDWHHAPHLASQDYGIIDEALAQIATQLEHFGQTADRYGLIHADLRLTNLLLKEQQIAVIDFDDCGMSWYMHDLAAAISFNEHHAAAPQWLEHWLKGYERIAHISDEEYALIPSLIMQRRIQMLAWNGSHAQTEMAQSLGDQWSNESVRLCKQYLNNQIPIGAGQ